MPVTVFWLGRAAGATCVLALTLALWLFLVARAAPARRWLRRKSAELDERFRYLRWRVRGSQVLAAQAAITGLFSAAALWKSWALIGVIPIVIWFPAAYSRRKARERTTRIEEQIESWLNALGNALKASPSLRDGLGSCLPLLTPPISQELDILLKENELGTPLDQALDNMARRIQSRTLSGAVLGLKVARRSGGNLPAMLEQSAAGLREMARLEGVVRTKTAEGKAQAFVVAVIPVPMVVGMHWMDPQFFVPLATTFTGHLVALGAAVLWILAILAARKILDVDI